MNAPFDPEETHGGSEHEDPFDENSVTWGSADPDFDRMLRDRLGPIEPMPTPPYAFERVLVSGRRRRARKVWAVGAAAALVVMAGTAGTTVALHGASVNGGTLPPAATSTQRSTIPLPTASSPLPSPSVSSASASPSGSTPPASASSSASSSTVPACHSDDLQLTVSLQPGANDLDDLLIVLRNNSGHTCTTFGFPGLQTETVNEQLQSTTVVREGKSDVQTLTLAQGASVSTLAEFDTLSATATPGASPAAGCAAPSYYLAVIPPDEQSQLVATITGGPVTVCGNGVMDTMPFSSGSAG